MLENLLSNSISLEDVLNYYNANISYVYLPRYINGFVWSYQNVYNIFINSSLSSKKKKDTIIHELAHIELNHLNQVNSELFSFMVDKYEDDADMYIKVIREKLNN